MELTFLGAAGTVTGSKYLLRAAGRTLLVDCGLFQGLKALRLLNREPFPVDPAEIDAVLLTHAHLDHTGFLPVLVRDGFRGRVHCTPATDALCRILLPDSGKLQEEEAGFANRRGYSRHHPALPLYTAADAARSLHALSPVPFRSPLALGGDIRATWVPSGHIMGAGSLRVETPDGTVVFSGDIGHDPMLPEPEHPGEADWLLVESTYGDRLHGPTDPATALVDVITTTAARGGAVVLPAFAVGRAQMLLWLLLGLRREGRLPDVPIYLDSPMAAAALQVLRLHPEAHRLGAAEAEAVARVAEVVETPQESRRVMREPFPRVIIAASGMATGGRVLHHLAALAPDPKNTVCFAGYQAPGTRGADILAGAESVKIHGQQVRIRAEVRALDTLSAHADRDALLAWLERFRAAPERCYMVHGEPHAAGALAALAGERLGWRCSVPTLGERTLREGPPPA
jgi:metallo-beta-lactamase family protein